MTNKRLFIVRDPDDKLVAVFTNKEDCTEFIQDNYFERDLDYVELVIEWLGNWINIF